MARYGKFPGGGIKAPLGAKLQQALGLVIIQHFPDHGLGQVEIFGQLPGLPQAGGHSGLKALGRKVPLVNIPIGDVLLLLPDGIGALDGVKGPGGKMAFLMKKNGLLLGAGFNGGGVQGQGPIR